MFQNQRRFLTTLFALFLISALALTVFSQVPPNKQAEPSKKQTAGSAPASAAAIKKTEQSTPAKPATPSSPAKPMSRRIIEVKHVPVEQLAQVLNIFPIRIIPSEELKVISLEGPEELVNAAEDAIHRLDHPGRIPPMIDLTVYILEASEMPLAAEGPLPEPLQRVANSIKKQFAYQHFQLIDTLVGMCGEGGDIILQNGGKSEGSLSYFFRADDFHVLEPGSQRFLETRKIIIEFNTGGQIQVERLVLAEGRLTVVGKTTYDNPHAALVLVLEAKTREVFPPNSDEPGPGMVRVREENSPGIISLTALEVSLHTLLNTICENLKVNLQPDDVALNQPVSIDMHRVSFRQVLDQLAKQAGFTYTLSDTTLSLKRKPAAAKQANPE